MQVIWKERVPYEAQFTLQMPRAARVLSVQMQNGDPYLWFLIPDTSADKVERKFYQYGTGEQVEEIKGKYIGTFQVENYFVFHLFEDSVEGRVAW